MTRTTIRKARARDCADLTRIAHHAKRFWGYPKKLMRLWGDTLTITPEFVSSHQVYCAARGADLLGFYALSISGATCELEHMWVAPEHMRAGVGRLLFRHLLKRVADSGATQLRIASDPMRKGSTGGWVRAGSGAKRLGPRAGSCRCSSCRPSVLDQHRRADVHQRRQIAHVVVVDRDAAPRPVDALAVQPGLVGAVDADRAADAGYAVDRGRGISPYAIATW